MDNNIDINFINQVRDNFDFIYIIVVNILTYCVIKFIDVINRDKIVTTMWKRIILVIAVFLVAIVYIITGYDKYDILFNSAIAAPVFWSWILKPIFVKNGLDYKKIDDVLN